MTKSPVPAETESAIITLVDWARDFLATEVEGQYTSDAALHLALAVWLNKPPLVQINPTGDRRILGDTLP